MTIHLTHTRENIASAQHSNSKRQHCLFRSSALCWWERCFMCFISSVIEVHSRHVPPRPPALPRLSLCSICNKTIRDETLPSTNACFCLYKPQTPKLPDVLRVANVPLLARGTQRHTEIQQLQLLLLLLLLFNFEWIMCNWVDGGPFVPISDQISQQKKRRKIFFSSLVWIHLLFKFKVWMSFGGWLSHAAVTRSSSGERTVISLMRSCIWFYSRPEPEREEMISWYKF